MKKIITITTLLLLLLFVPGCIRYGGGQSNGYVYAVDDGIVWDKVWFKPNLSSTESDCYLVDPANSNLKEQLKNLPSEANIKIKYVRHLMTFSYCGGDGTSNTDDELVSFEVIQ